MITSMEVSRYIMKKLVDLYKESELGKLSHAYNGLKRLYTAGSLPFMSKNFDIFIDVDCPS